MRQSPGDIGPNGSGLDPRNHTAMYVWKFWRQFGADAVRVLGSEVEEPVESLMEKIMLISQYASRIEENMAAKAKAEQDRIAPRARARSAKKAPRRRRR